VITPIGILAVNASAFVMVHLAAFRIGIAACALLSGLVLNGLTAWWLLRLASRNAPPLYREYRTWAIGAAVFLVLVTAVGGGRPEAAAGRPIGDRRHVHDLASVCGLRRREASGRHRRHHPCR